jgi:electron transfer flavoprotein alpha subunit
MSNIVVFAEVNDGKFKKSTLEAISYGAKIASSLGTGVTAVAIGNAENESEAGLYGADKLIRINGGQFSEFDPSAYSKAIAEAIESEGATTVVVSNTYTGKSVAPRLAVKTNSALVTGVVDHADTSNGLSVKKSVFSGKAIAEVKLNKGNNIVSLIPNSVELEEYNKTAEVVEGSTSTSDADVSTTVVSTDKVAGKIPLTEAELVVSGGRGLKGPENWGMIEELADIIGAATACSKPVADMDWRPHGEHVGQTGITIKPNLYIAIGISGAIQHLAGVSSSKVIVVINKDPEAPFFKAADYGIVGDAFEVLPKLIEAAKSASAS